jgi:hypothetical protein
MFILLSIMVSIGSAINGSINQQKITRGYFFARVSGNSTIPIRSQLIRWKENGIHHAGFYTIGWRDYTGGGGAGDGSPIAPCYKASTLVKAISGDKCLNKIEAKKTNYVRVKTAFGICTATYELTGSSDKFQARVLHENMGSRSCSLRK